MVIASFKLIHYHFPNTWIAPRRAMLVVARTRVWHFIVECVRPKWWIWERCYHWWIVHETKLFHHQKLTIPTDTKERHSHSTQIFHANVGKFIDNIRLTDHFIEPIFNCSVPWPPFFGSTVPEIFGNAINSNHIQAFFDLVFAEYSRTTTLVFYQLIKMWFHSHLH